MKYSFALAAIVAIASAQSEAPADAATAEINEYVPEPEPSLAEKLFELNEDGQFQLVWPKKPTITVTDADDQAIMAYLEGKLAESNALDMEYLQALKDY